MQGGNVRCRRFLLVPRRNDKSLKLKIKKMNPLRTNIQSAFTYLFCFELEAHLSVAFHKCDDKKYKWLWCDGIQIPDWYNQPSKNPRHIFTSAGFGETRRQHLYKMTIKLGKRALENCREGLGLNDCLPDDDNLDWVTLDMENKEIVLRLK
jgi:hypothetical protein